MEIEKEKIRQKKNEIVDIIYKVKPRNEKKLNKKEFKNVIETLERLSLLIQKLDEDIIYFALVSDDVLKKRLSSLFKQNFEFGNIVKNYLKDKSNFNNLIIKMFRGTLVEKEFGQVNNFRDLLNIYLKILKNKDFLSLLKKIKDERSDLVSLIKSFDLITLYFFIKKILPLLIASGLSLNTINKITTYLSKLSAEGRIVNLRKILLFIPRLREFIYAFGTPDGKALLLFLEGKPWE